MTMCNVSSYVCVVNDVPMMILMPSPNSKVVESKKSWKRQKRQMRSNKFVVIFSTRTYKTVNAHNGTAYVCIYTYRVSQHFYSIWLRASVYVCRCWVPISKPQRCWYTTERRSVWILYKIVTTTEVSAANGNLREVNAQLTQMQTIYYHHHYPRIMISLPQISSCNSRQRNDNAMEWMEKNKNKHWLVLSKARWKYRIIKMMTMMIVFIYYR